MVASVATGLIRMRTVSATLLQWLQSHKPKQILKPSVSFKWDTGTDGRQVGTQDTKCMWLWCMRLRRRASSSLICFLSFFFSFFKDIYFFKRQRGNNCPSTGLFHNAWNSWNWGDQTGALSHCHLMSWLSWYATDCHVTGNRIGNLMACFISDVPKEPWTCFYSSFSNPSIINYLIFLN